MVRTPVVLLTLSGVPALATPAPDQVPDKDQPHVSERLLKGIEVDRNLNIASDPLPPLDNIEYPSASFESVNDSALSINSQNDIQNDIQADLADFTDISIRASDLLIESPGSTEQEFQIQVFQTWITAQTTESPTVGSPAECCEARGRSRVDSADSTHAAVSLIMNGERFNPDRRTAQPI